MDVISAESVMAYTAGKQFFGYHRLTTRSAESFHRLIGGDYIFTSAEGGMLFPLVGVIELLDLGLLDCFGRDFSVRAIHIIFIRGFQLFDAASGVEDPLGVYPLAEFKQFLIGHFIHRIVILFVLEILIIPHVHDDFDLHHWE